MIIKDTLCGFLMALADSVPGVSGGTVAFMAGIYDPFIASFGQVVGRDRAARRGALLFLLRLGAGWIVGMALSVLLLSRVFTGYIYEVSSLFFGLVAASVPLLIYEERETLRAWKPWHIADLLLGVAAVVLLCFAHFSVATASLDPLTLCYVFVSGALAISAMVLPGISGSTLLLAFGLYVPVITGLRGLMRGDFSALPLLVVFGLGVLAGIFLTFRGIHYLLRAHRTATVYTVIGLMIGSLWAVLQGPTTLGEPLPAMGLRTFRYGFALVGAAVVAVFALAKYLTGKRRKAAETKAEETKKTGTETEE